METTENIGTQPPPPTTPGLALVIDDVEVNRILARAHLEILGWRVEEADDATRALRMLQAATPEMMLIDVRMPGLSGDQLAQQVRSRLGASIRLVGYTAHCMPDEIAQFLRCGFDHMLIKPASFADMVAAVGAPSKAPV